MLSGDARLAAGKLFAEPSIALMPAAGRENPSDLDIGA
jgi:hypothetical protein